MLFEPLAGMRWPDEDFYLCPVQSMSPKSESLVTALVYFIQIMKKKVGIIPLSMKNVNSHFLSSPCQVAYLRTLWRVTENENFILAEIWKATSRFDGLSKHLFLPFVYRKQHLDHRFVGEQQIDIFHNQPFFLSFYSAFIGVKAKEWLQGE